MESFLSCLLGQSVIIIDVLTREGSQLTEHSSKAFLQISSHYIHRLQHVFDSGAEINLLTNYLYISLDTFHSVSQNIDTELDAWLTFLSSDKPEDIIRLVEKYPKFKTYYHDIMLFRQKPKELMNMFSEALLKMDKNTATYMIEELEAQVKEQAREYEAKLSKIVAEKDARIAELEAQLAERTNHND